MIDPVFVSAGVLPRAALVHDTSSVGLGLVTPFAPPVGSILPIWLPEEGGVPSSLVFASVIFVLTLEDELSRVGARGHDEGSTGVLRQFWHRMRAAIESTPRRDPADPDQS